MTRHRQPCPFCGRPRPVSFWRVDPKDQSRHVGMVCRGCYAYLPVYGPPGRGWRALQDTCIAVWNRRFEAESMAVFGFRPCPLCQSIEITSFTGIEFWPGYDPFMYDAARCGRCGLIQRPAFRSAPADCTCDESTLVEAWNMRRTEEEWTAEWEEINERIHERINERINDPPPDWMESPRDGP